MLRAFIKLAASVQKMGRLEDSITTGLLGGLIGTLCMATSNILLYNFKKTEVTYAHIAGQFFVNPLRTKQRKNFILGELLHLAVGSVSGIPLLYMLKNTGKDHYLSKGLVASMLTWGVLYTGGQKVGLFKKLRLTKTHYSSAWNNTIYGLATAQAIVLIANPTIFTSSNKINQDASKQFTTKNDYSNFVGTNYEYAQSQQLH